MKISLKAKKVSRSGIREMFDLATRYKNVVSLGIGEPSFPTPEHIVESGINALRNGYTKYTPNAGEEDLRRAIANEYSNDKSDVSSENVIVANGATEALLLALLATINVGDEILVPDPSWPNYRGQIAITGALVKNVPTYEKDKFHLDFEVLKSSLSCKSRGLIINSPSNPTGAVLNKSELERIGELAIERNLIIYSDETYSKILFDGREHNSLVSFPALRDRVIVVNSFSKTYSMTGWRVGYAVGPKKIIQQMAKLQEGVASCVNSIAQQACIAALTGPQDCVIKMAQKYSERRDLLVNGLNALPGIDCPFPEGGFYAFPNISKTGLSSREMSQSLLKDAEVVVVPGTAFGVSGQGYLRVSLCGREDDLAEGLSRLKKFLKG